MNTEPKTERQLRFAIIGSDKAAWLYSASDIRLVRPDELAQVEYLARLGRFAAGSGICRRGG
ncbi:hypothetical protein [Marinobacter gelidimuriae]|uniref:hypothetical protein n=1 Tax=Marinobacter gelidimuriae TaxID=2739064 RepID=UPI0003A167FA|nr:hypothetical protein [Marinobacter gelidimuriae]